MSNKLKKKENKLVNNVANAFNLKNEKLKDFFYIKTNLTY